MVAISLYRGNLHRVPDVPRRWLMPKPTISLIEFRTLLARRSQAFSRSTSSEPSNVVNPRTISERCTNGECVEPASLELRLITGNKVQDDLGAETAVTYAHEKSLCEGDDTMAEGEKRNSDEEKEEEEPEIRLKFPVIEEKQSNEVAKQPSEAAEEEQSIDQSKKKARELEEKLQVLQERKHNLVQVLKQILSAEEQLKPKRDLFASSVRASVPLQGDVINDFGTISRQVTTRLGLYPNVPGDSETGDAEDIGVQNIQSRHANGSSSLSPSSESPIRKLFHQNMVAHPSPSRFAPTGFQGNAGIPPSISLSGTNYIASSPSPAASGGTSAFRDARHPSPWS